MPNIVMADQPSGGIELLASGTYTLASDAAIMSIPVSFNGTPYQFVVVESPMRTGTAHTCSWIGAWNLPKGGFWVANSCAKALYRLANNTYGTGVIQAVAAPDATLEVKEATSSYPIKAGTFKWEIWGVSS